MRISEVAGETGLSVSNIRFYEKKGLLSLERKMKLLKSVGERDVLQR